jgi:hypothetical protein
VLRSIKDYFFSAFREIFVYHHSSLEFRAKIYAILIVSGNESLSHYEIALETIASEIYSDSDRANALMMTVSEYIHTMVSKKHLGEEALLIDVIKELRVVPRYALKIEPDHLIRLQACTQNNDCKIYQERLIDFLRQKRLDYEEFKR